MSARQRHSNTFATLRMPIGLAPWPTYLTLANASLFVPNVRDPQLALKLFTAIKGKYYLSIFLSKSILSTN